MDDEDPATDSVPCKDISERDRGLLVAATSGRITLVAPPGEVAHIDARDYERLQKALRDAAVTAFRGAR